MRQIDGKLLVRAIPGQIPKSSTSAEFGIIILFLKRAISIISDENQLKFEQSLTKQITFIFHCNNRAIIVSNHDFSILQYPYST